MVTFINYYTCCYGDSLVAMFSDNPVQRKNGIAKCVYKGFIEPEFYNSSREIQHNFFNEVIDSGIQIVPCHRQFGYDFSQQKFVKTRVITVVDTGNINWLIKRFTQVHLTQRGKSLGNPLFESLRKNKPELTAQLVRSDYKKWLENNFLKSDIVFDLSNIYNPVLIQQFCKKHNLGFNLNWINDIVTDRLKYEE